MSKFNAVNPDKLSYQIVAHDHPNRSTHTYDAIYKLMVEIAAQAEKEARLLEAQFALSCHYNNLTGTEELLLSRIEQLRKWEPDRSGQAFKEVVDACITDQPKEAPNDHQ